MRKRGSMASDSTKILKVFYCYAHRDKVWRDALERHLEPMRRLHQIITWYDRHIEAGVEWKKEIEAHLNTSNIILILVSHNFLYSDYCYGIEMQRALERHKAGEARVIPIILRPAEWKETPLGELQALPTNGKPITSWRNRDEAFQDIAREIHNVVRTLLAQPQNRSGSALPFSIKSLTLRVLYPDIAEEWDPLENTLTPDNIDATSEQTVWWRCIANSSHKWQATISSRVEGYRCPVCTKKSVTDVMIPFGNGLRHERQSQGWSIYQVAERL